MSVTNSNEAGIVHFSLQEKKKITVFINCVSIHTEVSQSPEKVAYALTLFNYLETNLY